VEAKQVLARLATKEERSIVCGFDS